MITIPAKAFKFSATKKEKNGVTFYSVWQGNTRCQVNEKIYEEILDNQYHTLEFDDDIEPLEVKNEETGEVSLLKFAKLVNAADSVKAQIQQGSWVQKTAGGIEQAKGLIELAAAMKTLVS